MGGLLFVIILVFYDLVVYTYNNKVKKGGKAMASKSLIKAIRKYDDANTKKVSLKLNLNTDKDVLQKLDSVPNKQGYIKELIRADMGKRR